jgi:hypothetical protein
MFAQLFYLQFVGRVDGLLFQSTGTGTQLTVLCVVEPHAAVVVADLRRHQSHVGWSPPRLWHVLHSSKERKKTNIHHPVIVQKNVVNEADTTQKCIHQIKSIISEKYENNLQWLWSERRWLSEWRPLTWHPTNRRKWFDCLCLRRWETLPTWWTMSCPRPTSS